MDPDNRLPEVRLRDLIEAQYSVPASPRIRDIRAFLDDLDSRVRGGAQPDGALIDGLIADHFNGRCIQPQARDDSRIRELLGELLGIQLEIRLSERPEP